MSMEQPVKQSSSTHQVLLSFRAQDTCMAFTDHLYSALVQAGIQTLKDTTRIEQAIRESKVSLIVLSQGYALSQSCLDQLDVIMKHKEKLYRTVVPVFYDVDPSDVRKQKGRIGEALALHEKDLKLESSGRERVERWREALAKVADLGGMVLQNQDDGHESKFIRKIVNVVTNRISRTELYLAPHLIGIKRRVEHINSWLQDGSINVGLLVVCGMGGIGKTTLAKFIYNSNFDVFEGSSCVLNIREVSEQPNGLVKLQKQILSDILKREKERVSCVDEGIVKISDAVSAKRVLLVLDDLDDSNQVNAVLGMKSSFYPGSKIIITTRQERILTPRLVDKVYSVETLSSNESLELFSWYAFGKPHPVEGFLKYSNEVVKRCGGIPLALRVLGSSLAGQNLDVWQSTIEKLKVVPNNRIIELLKISYESLEDDDRILFLHIACFFVWEDKDFAVKILDKCELFTIVGIQNLIDRDLLSVLSGKLVMHQLIQDMGREIVRQQSFEEPGRRSRLWHHRESLYVLKNKTGTETIEGIILDRNMIKDHGKIRITSSEIYGKKRKLEEFLNNSQRCRPEQSWMSIFSSHTMDAVEVPNEDLVTDAFIPMRKLRFLLLSNIQLSGCYKKFPKKLRWLSWHCLQLESLPSDIPLESLVALDLRYSSLKQLWKGPKLLRCLKFLNLSHSYQLRRSPDFSELPNLEQLILEYCTNLTEIDDSIGYVEGLTLLNLNGCTKLRRIPESVCMLKFLETLDISGCSNLEYAAMDLPGELSDGIRTNQIITTKHVRPWHTILWSWLRKEKICCRISPISFPASLVTLRLSDCNLGDNAFLHVDCSMLNFLKDLDLSENPISCPPESIMHLSRLENLSLNSCTRLKSISEIPNGVDIVDATDCISLERVCGLPSSCGVLYLNCANLVQMDPYFKLEPLENVNEEIFRYLNLSNLELIRNVAFRLRFDIEKLHSNAKGFPKFVQNDMDKIQRLPPKRLPAQGFYCNGIFSTFLLSEHMPSWFNTKLSVPFHTSFTVTNPDNHRVRGLSFCLVYTCLESTEIVSEGFLPCISINNLSRRMKWRQDPLFLGIPEGEERMMWLSYWDIGDSLQPGDIIEVSASVGYDKKRFSIKEVGMRTIFLDEQQDWNKESAFEVEEFPRLCHQNLLLARVFPK
ncbi:disease resistance protein RPV1-like isoform X1 [Lycium barbarum]|uniref:disease resistance protein RPV1-like isoform X1 n=1 Tax=Lycium barbarum TaxID=112863 RepID=UPI00293F289F|nr:disease resistance protein RPV1-like isoform X1 [Lycium barbarum]XP_060207703.1 disease resistance protein RPV1-like isoform X1 [Lycium barbarum]XP_060207704.1 disease resistance protein RPV1-like isoform X1 [Lycium barbarum]XP_060207705.1 disease resistance protein RPV1-like isoform X1 [Lycium barbarum]